MARHLRVDYEGAIYHVSSRMIGDGRLEQSRLFVEDKDRERLLLKLKDRVELYNIRLYMFVLMTNHFHLVFETPEANCSEFMQSLLTAYTVYYNLRHDRHGHLLDGRYKAKLVDKEDYLVNLSRYVHLNPVKVGAVRNAPLKERLKCLRNYRWSTYPSYIGQSKAFDFVTYDPVLAEIEGRKKQRARRYREFVETGLAEDDAEFSQIMKESPRSIGGDSFRLWVDEMYEKLVEGYNSKEDVAFRKVCKPLPPEEVLSTLAEVFQTDASSFKERRRDSHLRLIAARCLMKYAGQSQREVANLLRMGSGSAVSKQVSRKSEELAKDREASSLLEKVERLLESKKQKTLKS